MKSIQQFLQESNHNINFVVGDLKNREDFKNSIHIIKRRKKSDGSSPPGGEIEDLNNIVNNQNSFVIFLKDNDILIGGVVFFQNKDKHKIGWIKELFVDEKYRNKGYGKKLIFEAIKHLKNNGCSEIMLKVFHLNKKAINLYRQIGFEYCTHVMKLEK